MPLTTIDFDISDNTPITQSVYSRVDWIDSWVNRSPVLFCRRVVWNVNPEMPEAILHYRYGDVDLYAGSMTTYRRHPPVTRGDYIKIDFVGHEIISGDTDSKNKTWYGQVTSLDDNDDGVITVTCQGLESILLEKDVNSSVWFDDRDALPSNWIHYRIDRVIPFNHRNRKNRTEEKDGGHYGFSGYDIYNGFHGRDYWTTRDIVEYLLKVHTPLSSTDAVAIPFELDDSNGLLPDWDSPELDPSGQKTKDLIDSLITRSRGVCYWLEVEDVGGIDTVKMKIGSYVSQEKDLPITNPPGLKLKQNPNRYVFLVDNLLEGSVRTSISAETKFDRVRCIGGRTIYCFSLSGVDKTLREKFLNEVWTAYVDGASDDPNYPPEKEIEKRERADRMARSNVQFKNVFSRVGVYLDDPDDSEYWDGMVGEGRGLLDPVDRSPAVPKPDDATTPQDVYPDEFRFLRKLPLLRNFSYLGASTPAVNSGQDDEHGDRYLPPQSFFQRPDDSSKWIEGSKIGTLAEIETRDSDLDLTQHDKQPPFDFSVSIEPDPDDSAFWVVVIGNQQHVIAPWDTSTDNSFGFWFIPLDYEEKYYSNLNWDYSKAIYTVAAYGNDYCEATVGDSNGVKDRVRTKTIHLGDRYQNHHVARGTVVGVDEYGSLKQRSVSGYIRDDSEIVNSIAEFAYNWYSLDRATVELMTHHFGDFQLGSIVSSLKAGESVTFDDAANKMTVVGAPYADDDAVVFYVDDSAKLPEPLTPGMIYYVTKISGNDYELSHQIGGTAIDLTTAGTGNAYVTDSGANTPITAIELDLPVEEDSSETGFSTTTIRTGHSEFDVNHFF